MKNPLVSIITPAYKAQKTIARATLSAIKQDCQDWEMIFISDDIQDYSQILKDANIVDDRLVFTTTNKYGSGASNARNQGLKIARGEFITVLDADDEFKPNKLSKMIPLVQEYGAAVNEIEMRNNETDQILKKFNRSYNQRFRSPENIIWSCFHNCNTYMYDRSKIPGLYYDNSLPVMEDTVYLMSFFNNIELIGYESTPLQIYYKCQDSLCNSPDTRKKFLEANYTILDKIESGKISIKNPFALNELTKYIKCLLNIDKKYNYILDAEIFFKELLINYPMN